jgi:Domain of unknown function (DUF4136)
MIITSTQRRVCLTRMMAITLLAACTSAPKVNVDQDKHVNFANYKTFAWVEPKSTDADDSKAAVVTLAGQRVHASITATLQAKGYTLDEVHPDVRVSYAFKVYERPKQSGMSIGLGAGGGSGNVGGGVGVTLPVGKRRETVGALTVNVIDAARNEQVWFGTSEIILSGSIATDTEVKALTDTILAKYPTRKE